MGRRFPGPGGSSSSGGGSGSSNALSDATSVPRYWSDEMVLVDEVNEYIDIDPTNSEHYKWNSGGTYCSIHALAHDGVFAWIGNNYETVSLGANAGELIVGSFKVDPSTGAIGTVNRHTMWSHNGSAIFSTCHQGAIGNSVINMGNHKNPNSPSSHVGTMYAANIDSAGAHSTNNWLAMNIRQPQNNAGLVVGATAADGVATARHSSYNLNTSTYAHYAMTFDGTSGTMGTAEDYYAANSTGNSNTSTHYIWPCAKSSKDDLEPGGIIFYYNTSGIGTAVPVYGPGCSRGTSDTTIGTNYWSSQAASFHLSNGDQLHCVNNPAKRLAYQVIRVAHNTGVITEVTPQPEDWIMSKNFEMLLDAGKWAPCKEDDTWIVSGGAKGIFKVHIDINDNYKLTITKQKHLLNSFGVDALYSYDGTGLGLVGPNDEYLVLTQIGYNAYYGGNPYLKIMSFENPFFVEPATP